MLSRLQWCSPAPGSTTFHPSFTSPLTIFLASGEVFPVVAVGGQPILRQLPLDGEGTLQLLRHHLEGVVLEAVPVGHEHDLHRPPLGRCARTAATLAAPCKPNSLFPYLLPNRHQKLRYSWAVDLEAAS